jgi:hypothetical protein
MPPGAAMRIVFNNQVDLSEFLIAPGGFLSQRRDKVASVIPRCFGDVHFANAVRTSIRAKPSKFWPSQVSGCFALSSVA